MGPGWKSCQRWSIHPQTPTFLAFLAFVVVQIICSSIPASFEATMCVWMKWKGPWWIVRWPALASQSHPQLSALSLVLWFRDQELLRSSAVLEGSCRYTHVSVTVFKCFCSLTQLTSSRNQCSGLTRLLPLLLSLFPLRFSLLLTLPYPLSDFPDLVILLFYFLLLLVLSLLWLIYAIILSSSIRVLSLFWRLVNSRLMIYQILITACWKPHSLSWCMVMIVPAWLLESQQTHSFIFFFLSPSRSASWLLFPSQTVFFLLCSCGYLDPFSNKTYSHLHILTKNA